MIGNPAEAKLLSIVGAGGHGRELLDIIEAINHELPTWLVHGFYDVPDGQVHRRLARRGSILTGGLDEVGPHDSWFAMGLSDPTARAAMASRWQASVRPATLIHPLASIHHGNTIGRGSSIAAGSRIEGRVTINECVHLDLGVIVGEGSSIGAFSVIGAGVVLGCGVTVGSRVEIGPGATIEDGVIINDDAVVASGALVMTNDDVSGSESKQG